MCKLVTVLLAPAMIWLLILGTHPEGVEWSVWLTLAAYLLAHVLFWPPWFATRSLVPRLQIQSLPGMAALMGIASAAIWLPAALIAMSVDQQPPYGWREVLRDLGELGVASSIACFLRSALSGLCRSVTVPPPNSDPS